METDLERIAIARAVKLLGCYEGLSLLRLCLSLWGGLDVLLIVGAHPTRADVARHSAPLTQRRGSCGLPRGSSGCPPGGSSRRLRLHLLCSRCGRRPAHRSVFASCRAAACGTGGASGRSCAVAPATALSQAVATLSWAPYAVCLLCNAGVRSWLRVVWARCTQPARSRPARSSARHRGAQAGSDDCSGRGARCWAVAQASPGAAPPIGWSTAVAWLLPCAVQSEDEELRMRSSGD